MSAEPRVLLTVEAAAERLSIGRTTMYALIKSGHIATVRVGRLRRIPTEALTAYAAALLAEQHAETAA
jgi:excisionase family DNA binding protein